MEYTKETTVGDITTYERYEGTPDEIAYLVMRLPKELKGGEIGEQLVGRPEIYQPNTGSVMSVEELRSRMEEIKDCIFKIGEKIKHNL